MVSVFGGDISLENDRRDNNRIQRRRERDEDRRRKLLNAKTRLMGVDRSALDIQVKENQMKKAAVKQAEALYAQSMMDIKHILEERNLQENELQVEESLKTKNVWDVQQQQHKERSTFDLNDPNELKKRPKWTDDDVVGASSMRRFAGEDLFNGDRRKMQAHQMKDWCNQIQAEKLIAKQKEQDEANRHSKYLMDVDSVREEMHQIEVEQRMADNFSCAETNAQLAAMRKAEREEERLSQKRMDYVHSQTIENDPMMRESRDQGESTVPGRVRRDHWKGMTVSQLQAVQAENYQVILNNQARKNRAAAEEVGWDVFFVCFFFCFD